MIRWKRVNVEPVQDSNQINCQYLFTILPILSAMSESAVDRNMKLENAIVQKALELETLQKRQNILESENAEKAAKLEQLKDNLTVTERNLEELSDRSTAMRDKLRNLDKNVQVEADKISVETKAFFKKLGLKVSQQLLPDENQVELKIQFRECLEFDATIIYDSETEDYDRK